MIVKLLTEHHLEFLSLKGGCRGSSESTHVKIPHCWKSHALAQFYFSISVIELSQCFDVCRDPEASRLPVHSSNRVTRVCTVKDQKLFHKINSP